jgi:hypothetical protein
MTRVRLRQHTPTGPPASFFVPDKEGPAGPGRYFHAICREANAEGAWVEILPGVTASSGSIHQHNHEPEWVVMIPKVSKNMPTPQRVANAVAGQMQNAGLGLIFVTRWEDGTPTFSAVYACNAQFVLCIRTTDPAVQPVEHPAIVNPAGWREQMRLAIEAARMERAKQARSRKKGA